MRVMIEQRLRSVSPAVILLLSVTIAACGDGPTEPRNGTVQVTTSTSGSNPDPDGYAVDIDNGAVRPITDATPVTFSDVEAGDHTLTLGGLSDNCTVVESPRTVTVSAGGTAQVSFVVSCSAPPATFSAVTAGQTHTCGLLSDGRGFCWGSNGTGELGSGSGNSLDSVPVPVAGDLIFRSLSAGSGFACGVTTGDQAYCWGHNNLGQIGDGTEDTDRPTPVPVAGGQSYQVVSAGVVGGCGVTVNDRAYCWGLNTSGQRGTPFNPGGASPPDSVVTDASFATVEEDGNHTCGLTPANAAFCWGSNGSGEQGNGAPPLAQGTPGAVAGGLTFLTVSVGSSYTCGLTVAGQAYCWGLNSRGQLGDGTTDDRSTPTPVAGGLTFTAIDAGGFQTCGIATGGQAYCWGWNNSGQLGNGTGGSAADESNTPVAVSGGLTFATISAGFIHTCGVTTGGEAWCWGNGGGLLGNNSTADSLVPVRVVTPSATP